jgi:hypothetical protein
MAVGTINDETQYARRVIILRGRFRINGVTTPDEFRDGRAGIILSVTRVSQGLFEVTLKPSFPIPKQITFSTAHLAQAAAPTAFAVAAMVRDTYDPVARTFRVATRRITGPATNDPDDNDVVDFQLVGPMIDAFKDPL